MVILFFMSINLYRYLSIRLGFKNYPKLTTHMLKSIHLVLDWSILVIISLIMVYFIEFSKKHHPPTHPPTDQFHEMLSHLKTRMEFYGVKLVWELRWDRDVFGHSVIGNLKLVNKQLVIWQNGVSWQPGVLG